MSNEYKFQSTGTFRYNTEHVTAIHVGRTPMVLSEINEDDFVIKQIILLMGLWTNQSFMDGMY